MHHEITAMAITSRNSLTDYHHNDYTHVAC